jgi:hypothetical protein
MQPRRFGSYRHSARPRRHAVKGSRVKRSAEQWRLRVSDHVAFFSYRWLTWAVAALALTLPGRPAGTLPRDAGLLLLIGVINVVATALAQSYVRVLRQRPLLQVLDLLLCATVLWLSGSQPLPFFPYALASLVLPALIGGWRGAALSAAAFSALDLFGLALLSPTADANSDPTALIVRLLTPFAFAGTWAALGRLLPRNRGAGGERQPRVVSLSAPLATPDAADRQRSAMRVIDLQRPERGSASSLANLTSTAPLLLARPAEPQAPPPRRVPYTMQGVSELSLASALEQLAATVGEQSGLEIRASLGGTARALNVAQQTVLLRTAQESLLNVQQHARAHSALVSLSFEPRAVTLVVQDDGVGLLDGTYERPGLHALRAVRYRLAELDGQLAVFESESGGVIVRATLPLE